MEKENEKPEHSFQFQFQWKLNKGEEYTIYLHNYCQSSNGVFLLASKGSHSQLNGTKALGLNRTWN